MTNAIWSRFGEVRAAGRKRFPWLYGAVAACRSARWRVTVLSRCGWAGPAMRSTICYENTLPHRIRSEVVTLREENREPDVLVNLTNDGWYWGSSELDMHLAWCRVFARGGMSQPIFNCCQHRLFQPRLILQAGFWPRGGRRTTDVIVANTRIDHRRKVGIWITATVLAGAVSRGGRRDCW